MRCKLALVLLWLVSSCAVAGVVTLSADQTTTVDSSQPDTNFYYNGVFSIDVNRIGYIRFHPDSVLCASGIVSANLVLLPVSSAPDGLQMIHHLTPVSFSAPDVTWNNRPISEIGIAGVFGPVLTGPNVDHVPISIDVTSSFYTDKCGDFLVSISGANNVRLFFVAAGTVYGPQLVVTYGPAEAVSQAMTTLQVVTYCMSAFGLGFAAGSVQRIFRKSIEVLE
jgi:hypothetical protein